MTTEATAADLHAFTERWLDWYRAQEARLADPHGSWRSRACTGWTTGRSASPTLPVPGTPASTGSSYASTKGRNSWSTGSRCGAHTDSVSCPSAAASTRSGETP